MKMPVSKRRPRGTNRIRTSAAPRLKPNELRSWMLRGLRSLPTTDLPNRSDLEDLFAQFDLTESERRALVDGIEQEIG